MLITDVPASLSISIAHALQSASVHFFSSFQLDVYCSRYAYVINCEQKNKSELIHVFVLYNSRIKLLMYASMFG